MKNTHGKCYVFLNLEVLNGKREQSKNKVFRESSKFDELNNKENNNNTKYKNEEDEDNDMDPNIKITQELERYRFQSIDSIVQAKQNKNNVNILGILTYISEKENYYYDKVEDKIYIETIYIYAFIVDNNDNLSFLVVVFIGEKQIQFL